MSRSTWACELKLPQRQLWHSWTSSHAPRERVSWNLQGRFSVTEMKSHAPRERVSWNLAQCMLYYNYSVTLHVSVWVEMVNTEIAYEVWGVTLHVSVWVEINHTKKPTFSSKSRSTWACELKYLSENSVQAKQASRSTWACELKLKTLKKSKQEQRVTLHVSVWVEIDSREYNVP